MIRTPRFRDAVVLMGAGVPFHVLFGDVGSLDAVELDAFAIAVGESHGRKFDFDAFKWKT